jgi:hypothetical protein
MTGSITRIREPAVLERKAATADALRETVPQAFELGYTLIDPAGPTA